MSKTGYPNTLKYFMWGYQVHYKIACEVSAESLFHSLDRGLNPNVFILGFPVVSDNNSFVCFEPENIDYLLEDLSGIEDLHKEIFESDERRNMLYSGRGMQEKMDIRLQKRTFKEALERLLNNSTHFKNKLHFSANEVEINGYRVFVILQLEKDIYESHIHLEKTKSFNDLRISRSLLETVVDEFLNEAEKGLYEPDPGASSRIPGKSTEDMLRAAAKNFMYTVSSKGMEFYGLHGLFESCNKISITKYEGHENFGNIIISKMNDPNIEPILSLEHPFEISNIRKTRKLLQLTNDRIAIISNSHLVFGLGKMKESYKPVEESIFNIRFRGIHCWDVEHAGKVILQMRYGIPELQKETISGSKFKSDLIRLFPQITDAQISRLYVLAMSATNQKHGALLIISGDAKKEAQRLSRQCIEIKPVSLTEELVQDITAIDGGVIIDIDGTAYAQGVILDGIVGSKGDSARGSRFNSALTYYEFKGKEIPTMLVVVSEDGMVDTIPNLLPQVNHSEIIQVIQILEDLNNEEEVDVGIFNKSLDWLRNRQFYLTPEECQKINTLKNNIDGKINSTQLKIIREDFYPNPEMNDSYYIAN